MGKFGIFDDEGDKQATKPALVKEGPVKRVIKDTWSIKPFPKSPAKKSVLKLPIMDVEEVVVKPIKVIDKNKTVEQQVQDTLDLISKMERDWFRERETQDQIKQDKAKQDQLKQDQIQAEANAKAARDKAEMIVKEEQTRLAKEQQKVSSPLKAAPLVSLPQELPKKSPLQILPSTAVPTAKLESIPNPAQPLVPFKVNPPQPVNPQIDTQTKQPPREVGTKKALETSAAILHKLEQVKGLKNSLPAQYQNQLLRDKMKINRTVGQLTNSQKKLVPLIKDLNLLFTSNQTQVEYYQILLYLCAKKIVKQAEMEISVKQESCFPIGILVVHLSTKHPEFNQILLGRMMKKCPYIVPCYPRKQADESKEAYQARLGYKMKGKNVQY
jgi:nucleoporin GLE1